MTRGLLFWVIFVLWILFGFAGSTRIYNDYHTVFYFGSWLIPAILIGLLGWGIYGAPVKG